MWVVIVKHSLAVNMAGCGMYSGDCGAYYETAIQSFMRYLWIVVCTKGSMKNAALN